MEQTAAHTLNDLILINNDRIKGYEKALKDLDAQDGDLAPLFNEMISQTRRFNADLSKQVELAGAQAETETSVSGKLHRAWIDIKATFAGNSRRSLLCECERGEDASKEAYQEALHEHNSLSTLQSELVAAQAREQSASHDRIKVLRDEAIAKEKA